METVSITTDFVRIACHDLFKLSASDFKSKYPAPLVKFINDNLNNERLGGNGGHFKVDQQDFEFYLETNAKIQRELDKRDPNVVQDNDVVFYCHESGELRMASYKSETCSDASKMTLTSLVCWAFFSKAGGLSFQHSGRYYYPARAPMQRAGRIATKVQYQDRHGMRASCSYITDAMVSAWIHPSVDVEALARNSVNALEKVLGQSLTKGTDQVETLLNAYEAVAADLTFKQRMEWLDMGSQHATLIPLLQCMRSQRKELLAA